MGTAVVGQQSRRASVDNPAGAPTPHQQSPRRTGKTAVCGDLRQSLQRGTVLAAALSGDGSITEAEEQVSEGRVNAYDGGLRPYRGQRLLVLMSE